MADMSPHTGRAKARHSLPVEYLMRVRFDQREDEFEASLRQFAATRHPEVRCVVGPVSYGKGANAEAAMLAAICSAHIGTVTMPRGSRYA